MDAGKPDASTASTVSSADAQLAEKNVQKLNLEIETLRIQNRRSSRAIPIVATCLAILGFFFTVIQFQCGRRSEQEKERASREAAQQRDRSIRAAEQFSRCHSQLREDTDELIKSVHDKGQTAARVFFLLEDVKGALSCRVNETQKLSDFFPNYQRGLTESLVVMVRDDYDFTNNPKEVALTNAIANRWTDYADYLASQPRTLDYILYKYTRALQDLRDQNRGYITCLEIDKPTNQVTVCREFETRKNEAALYNYFSDLVAGFKDHVEMLGSGNLDEAAQKRKDKILLDFQESICKKTISEHYLGTYLPGGTCQGD
jgi:hypothetical protein